MAGGKRKGAGRKPIPEHLKKKTYSTRIRYDQIEWIKRKPHGWFAKWLEKAIDTKIKGGTDETENIPKIEQKQANTSLQIRDSQRGNRDT